jgi:hypothetical protein
MAEADPALLLRRQLRGLRTRARALRRRADELDDLAYVLAAERLRAIPPADRPQVRDRQPA